MGLKVVRRKGRAKQEKMRKEGPCAVSSGCSLAFRHPRRPGGGAAVQSQWELVRPRSGSIVERDCSGCDSGQ